MNYVQLEFRPQYADTLEWLGLAADEDFRKCSNTVHVVDFDVTVWFSRGIDTWLRDFYSSDLRRKYTVKSAGDEKNAPKRRTGRASY
jgi:hypothetical protein